MQRRDKLPFGDRVGKAIGIGVACVVFHPRITLLIVSMCALIAVAAMFRLTVDTDSSRMLSKSLAFQQRLDALNAAFPNHKDVLLIAVRSPSADAADQAVVEISTHLSARTETFDWVFAPSADPFLVTHGLLYLEVDELEQHLGQLAKQSNLIAKLRSDQTAGGFLDALDEITSLVEEAQIDVSVLTPVYAETAAVLAAQRIGAARSFDWTAALAGGGDEPVVRLITAHPRLDFTAIDPAEKAMTLVRSAVEGLDPELADMVEVGVTGDPALQSDELQSLLSRIWLSTAMSLLLVALILWLALGSARRVLLTLGALSVTLLLTAGFAAVAVGALNLISIAFVVLMIGLGIDFSLHFLMHFEERRLGGWDRHEALKVSASTIGTALLLSSLTTSLAFFGFATTDFAGMAQLGLIGGVGVLIALVVTLTVIPAAIALWPGLATDVRRHRTWQVSPAFGRAALVLALVLGAGGAALAPSARFDADPMNLRDPAAPSVVAYRWLAADPDLALQTMSILADDRQSARALAARLAAVPEVRAVLWLEDLIPKDQETKLELIDFAFPSIMHAVQGTPVDLSGAGSPAAAADLARRIDRQAGPLPAELAEELRSFADRRTAAQDAELAHRLFRSFPLLIDRVERQMEAGSVSAEDLPQKLSGYYVAEDGRLRVTVMPRADISDPAALRRFVDSVAEIAPDASGPPDQIRGAAVAVGAAVLHGTAFALVGCFILTWLTLGGLVWANVVLVPLLLAGFVVVGASVLLDQPFNYANAIVIPLLIGIGIDSGVHFSARAATTTGSVFATSTPRAVFYSALTTVAAFATLGISDHRGTASMGILLAVALVASVFMVFAVAPSLVRLVGTLRN